MTENSSTRRRILRPSGLSVFAGLVVFVGVIWWLYADRWVERGVENTGASLTGARVDVGAADLRPTEGIVRLTGLQVANPDQPMKNLFEAESIVGQVRIEPLLQKKVVLERVEVLGVRFGTDRSTSGALENPDPAAGALWREIDAWADAIEVPELSLDALTGVVRTEAISADSLATVRFARDALLRVDSLGGSWDERLERIDPRPRIDSVRAVVERLEQFRLTPTTALQLPGLLRDGRSSLQALTSLQGEVAALDDSVRTTLAGVVPTAERLAELRTRDLAYARSLLDLPSLEAPSVSPALFGGTALSWMRPMLYWARTAERFLPPGLDPRNRPGPRRARAEGTTYDFRRGAEWPAFLVEQGDVTLSIDGRGAAAGAYTATVRDLTTTPAAWSEPTTILIGREAGPSSIQLAASLDHTGDVLRDSLELVVRGLELPAVSVSAFGGSLSLGVGDQRVSARRVGDEISLRLEWSSDDISWQGAGVDTTDALEIGSADWGRSLVQRAVAGLERIELTVGLDGSISSPSLVVESNLGGAVAASLRREVGREIEAAENRIRAEITAQAAPHVERLEGEVERLRAGVAEEVGSRRAEVEAMRARLEARIEALVGGVDRSPSGSVR